MNTFPDISLSFQKMKLQDLIAANNHPSLFAQTCQANAYGSAFGEVVKMIKEQAQDNRVMIVEMFGKDVITIIDTL